MMITIKKEGIKKRGTIKKQISLFWIVLIISLFQIGIAYASNNHTFFKYKYYPSDESANFTSPGIWAFILQELPLTSQLFPEIKNYRSQLFPPTTFCLNNNRGLKCEETVAEDYCSDKGYSYVPNSKVCDGEFHPQGYWGPTLGGCGPSGSDEWVNSLICIIGVYYPLSQVQVQLFDDSYYLCHSSMGNSLCDYMKNPENSDDLSDYKIFFELYEEFDNITYGGTYRDENAVFQGGDGTTLVEQDYRNMTIGFCDPDEKSGDQCKTCKLGYDLSNEEETIRSRTWDLETEECCGDDYIEKDTTNGPSMDYRPDFLYQHVDEPDFSEDFCERCPLGNDKENPSLREWNPTAHCCGDDDGTWYLNLNHSGLDGGSTIDGFNNKADCAKLVNNGQFLCNVHRNPSTNQSEWYNAIDWPGEIAFIPCIDTGTFEKGLEAVSDTEKWIGCGTSISTSDHTNQFTGDFFTKEMRIDFGEPDNYWKHSYFCIFPPGTRGLDTIYECHGDRASKSSGGIDSEGGKIFTTGESFEHNSGGTKTYYCAYQTDTDLVTNELISTLDTKSTLWTTDLDLTNKNTCEKAGLIWTGKDEYHLQGDSLHNFCCSEADDNETTIDDESYNDPEGNGICFRSKYQPNNAFVFKDNHTYTEVYVMNGTQHGCALDEEAALSSHCSGRYGGCTGAKPYTFSGYYNADTNKPYDGSFPGAGKRENDFLITMKNKPNPAEFLEQGILIQDHSYCDIIDKTEGEEVGKYYCSYEEKWEETGGENLTHLSFTEWPVGEGLKRAECCEPTQCWDEQQCIETQHANAVSPPFRSISDGYRCIFGEWYYSYLKYNWDNTVSGWCPRNDQCLVNPSGIYEEFSNPQCVDSETYLGDHYCEDGKWTSRTKFLALQLLSLMEREDEYTIYCDNYRNTLNNINYTIFTNAEDYVKYPRQERTGLQPFESANNFCIVRYGENNNIIIGTTINHPVNLGDPTNFLNVFEESATCPESGQTYQKCGSSNIYHNNKTNSIIFSKESLSFQEPDQNIFSYFDNLFEFIFNWEPKYGFDLTYNFIEDTKDFNKLYVSNQQQIIAITENVWPSSGKEHITVKYSGIGADVCDSIEAYDSSIGEADYLQCTENSGSHYVVSGLPEGVNMWPKLTSKLRPKS